jgi:phenylpyruvate tautomerase PptA (4-oxalocrotonate tautomerase family)
MTILRVSLVGSLLTSESKERLVDRLLGAFAEVEVGRDSPAIRKGFLVHFESVAREDLWMGMQPMAEASEAGRAAVVTAQVMAGPWNPEMKAALFERVEAAVREIAGMPKQGNGADFWMTFVEVPEGGWGLGGKGVSIRSLAPVFAGAQQERIRDHLVSSGPGDPG